MNNSNYEALRSKIYNNLAKGSRVWPVNIMKHIYNRYFTENSRWVPLEIHCYTVMSCILTKIWILFVYRSRTSKVCGNCAAFCTRLRSRILFSGLTSKPFLDVFRFRVAWKCRSTRRGLTERIVDHSFVSQTIRISSYCHKTKKALPWTKSYHSDKNKPTTSRTFGWAGFFFRFLRYRRITAMQHGSDKIFLDTFKLLLQMPLKDFVSSAAFTVA